MQKIKVNPGAKLEDYKAYGSLYHSVLDFLDRASKPVRELQGKTIWMINSTAIGGGVAEMLPSQMRILRELNVKIEWLVIEADDDAFFDVTKRLHNAIHGSGNGEFDAADREIYEKVNHQNRQKALDLIRDGDLVVIHDPQPLPLGSLIKAERDVRLFWRCHIGLDEETPVTHRVWAFMTNYLDDYDHCIFSLPVYVPAFLRKKTTIIPPAIDPLSHKNRSLQLHKTIGILHQSGIIENGTKVLYNQPYAHQVRRVQADGTFGRPHAIENMDLIYRSQITQISRWDRLKGFQELMEAFIHMKKDNRENGVPGSLDYRRAEMSMLVLGGPDPAFVSDDPEGKAVLDELTDIYKKMDPGMQNDIAILLLPLHDTKENALIVNALQRSSSFVVQNSIREGFGLTATEAMWKRIPMLVSGAAGLRYQVEDRVTGRINGEPSDTEALSRTMREMLDNPKARDKWGLNGQIRVIR